MADLELFQLLDNGLARPGLEDVGRDEQPPRDANGPQQRFRSEW